VGRCIAVVTDTWRTESDRSQRFAEPLDAACGALDRLTALGQAQLTSDKPRRYRHQATAGPPPRPSVGPASR